MDTPFFPNATDPMKAAKEVLGSGSYEVSEHVLRHLRSQALSFEEMESSIGNGVIIEVHTNPKRGKGYQVLQFGMALATESKKESDP